jgi:cell division septal protein FtsQ
VTHFLQRLGEQAVTVDVIDARYSGGVAVKLKEEAAENPEQPGESQA